MKSKVFVVDDDPVFTKIIEHNFNAQNVKNILVLDSGEACINHLNAKPRLILLDFSMGGLNGLDVLNKIKEQSPKTEVIILTALEDESVKAKCLQAGASDYINKDESGLDKIRDEVIPRFKSSGLFSLFK